MQIQARQRGRIQRRGLRRQKEEEHAEQTAAATAIQARHRGRNARRHHAATRGTLPQRSAIRPFISACRQSADRWMSVRPGRRPSIDAQRIAAGLDSQIADGDWSEDRDHKQQRGWWLRDLIATLRADQVQDGDVPVLLAGRVRAVLVYLHDC